MRWVKEAPRPGHRFDHLNVIIYVQCALVSLTVLEARLRKGITAPAAGWVSLPAVEPRIRATQPSAV